jgi:hypothetical protein
MTREVCFEVKTNPETAKPLLEWTERAMRSLGYSDTAPAGDLLSGAGTADYESARIAFLEQLARFTMENPDDAWSFTVSAVIGSEDLIVRARGDVWSVTMERVDKLSALDLVAHVYFAFYSADVVNPSLRQTALTLGHPREYLNMIEDSVRRATTQTSDDIKGIVAIALDYFAGNGGGVVAARISIPHAIRILQGKWKALQTEPSVSEGVRSLDDECAVTMQFTIDNTKRYQISGAFHSIVRVLAKTALYNKSGSTALHQALDDVIYEAAQFLIRSDDCEVPDLNVLETVYGTDETEPLSVTESEHTVLSAARLLIEKHYVQHPNRHTHIFQEDDDWTIVVTYGSIQTEITGPGVSIWEVAALLGYATEQLTTPSQERRIANVIMKQIGSS